MIRISLVILILGHYGLIHAQQLRIPPIVERLYIEKKPVTVFSHINQQLYFPSDLPNNFKTSGNKLVKTSEGLFLNILGTGRIYQLEKADSGFYWKRLDSTYYTGYNFGSLFFHWGGEFYSFGGLGFFNYNGNLRYFNSNSKEWDAAVLSQSIHWTGTAGLFHYLDSVNGKLYVTRPWVRKDQLLKDPLRMENKNSLWVLDIKNGEWTSVGRTADRSHTLIAVTPYGTMIGSGFIADIENNKLYRFSSDALEKLNATMGSSANPREIAYSYCIDSVYYAGDLNGFIDSAVIHKSDIIDTGQSFYQRETAFSSLLKVEYAWMGIAALMSISMLFVWYRSRVRLAKLQKTMNTTYPTGVPQLHKSDRDQQVIYRSGKIMDLLDEREKNLLSFIYNHSKEERLTSIDEINRVIGASQRSMEIQKRLRSDLIGSINTKLEILTGMKSNVIEKQRSEFDKRSFEYFIPPDKMEIAEKVLGKKIS